MRADREKRMLLVPVWYRLRKRLGLQEVSETRLAKLGRVHPGEDAAALAAGEDEKRLCFAAVCVLGGIMMAVLSALVSGRTFYTTISRPDYGEEREDRVLKAAYMDGEYDVPVTVESRRYSLKEWETLRVEAYGNITGDALGDNADWKHITAPLNLSEDTGIPGISAFWESGDPDIISFDGGLPEIGAAYLPAEVSLDLTICHEDLEWKVRILAVRCAPERTPDERTAGKIAFLIRQAGADREQEEIVLPKSMEDGQIRFFKEEGVPPAVFVLLGAVLAFCAAALPVQRLNEKIRERESDLIRSYPEIVSTLAVLIGAGLTVRGALRRMADGYKKVKGREMKERAAYEEIIYALHSFDKGVNDEDVYAEFGRRCGLNAYMRLSGLLSTEVKLGNGGLVPLLGAEAEQALAERLRNARKYGEEASSKLLLPMIMLLLVVFILLLAPAFLSF